MTRLLALDPGGTTGWSRWFYDDDNPLTAIDHGQVDNGVDGLVKWWGQWARGSFDQVVSESFILDGRTAFPNVQPLRCEGALVALWPAGVIYQRNVMKVHADNDFLKRVGSYWPGQGHAVDSARHAYAYVKTTKHMPSLRAFWGPRSREPSLSDV